MMAKRKISVDLSMQLAKEGFRFLGLEKQEDSSCDECGHEIVNEFWFMNTKRNTRHKLGGTCQFKVYLFKMFKNIDKARLQQGSRLLDIGALLWKMDRDKLYPFTGDAKEENESYVMHVIKKDKIPINLKELPTVEYEEWYWKTLKYVYSRAVKLRKFYMKLEEAEKEEKEAKKAAKADEEARKKYAIELAKSDADFMNLANKNLEKNPSLNDKRMYLLKKYVQVVMEWGTEVESGWTISERDLAKQLAGLREGEVPVDKERQTRDLVTILEQMLLYISLNDESSWVRGFAKDIAERHIILKGLSVTNSKTGQYRNSQRELVERIVNDAYKSPTMSKVLLKMHDPARKSIRSILDDVDTYIL